MLLCASCSHTETMSYPERWASKPVAIKQNCSDIDGTYKAIGENAQYSDNGVNNPHFFALFGFYSNKEGNIIHLKISNDGSKLTMSTQLLIGDKAQEKLKEVNVSCTNGEVVFKDNGQSYSDGNTIQWSSSLVISKTKDNAIVVHRYGTSNTGSFIFNVNRNFDVLYRFSSDG